MWRSSLLSKLLMVSFKPYSSDGEFLFAPEERKIIGGVESGLEQ